MIGQFITDQILGMKWLNALIGKLLSALGLDTAGRIGGSVQFFHYNIYIHLKTLILRCFSLSIF